MASRAPSQRYRYQPEPRARAASALLALAVVGLVIVLLIRMGVLPLLPTRPVSSTSTFDVAPDRPTPSKERTASHQQAAVHKASPPPPPSARTPPPVNPDKPVMPPGFIQLDGQTFAQSDLRRVPRHPEDAATSETADTGKGEGEGGGRAGAGEGPGGQRIYDAAWYVRPTDAQTGPYLPHMELPPGSWADIVCRMIDHYHVDDCREAGESPIGSGLARGLRRASWQFLVRPPRVDGKPQLGTRVRIHYDFYDRK